MQVGWDGGTNAVGMAWWHKCSWIGLVAQIQLECADDTNAAGLEWRHKCSRIGQVAQMQLGWNGGTNSARKCW